MGFLVWSFSSERLFHEHHFFSFTLVPIQLIFFGRRWSLVIRCNQALMRDSEDQNLFESSIPLDNGTQLEDPVLSIFNIPIISSYPKNWGTELRKPQTLTLSSSSFRARRKDASWSGNTTEQTKLQQSKQPTSSFSTTVQLLQDQRWWQYKLVPKVTSPRTNQTREAIREINRSHC